MPTAPARSVGSVDNAFDIRLRETGFGCERDVLRRIDAEPPKIACQVLVEFDSLQDVERMLASPERRALRSRVLEITSMFAGSIRHIDYEVA